MLCGPIWSCCLDSETTLSPWSIRPPASLQTCQEEIRSLRSGADSAAVGETTVTNRPVGGANFSLGSRDWRGAIWRSHVSEVKKGYGISKTTGEESHMELKPVERILLVDVIVNSLISPILRSRRAGARNQKLDMKSMNKER